MKELDILLVDDDPDIRTIVSIIIGGVAGWRVRLAASGAEALDQARDRRPDLVVMDVMMPDMNGPETVRALRALTGLADVPVVFLTASARTRDLERLGDQGVDPVLTKPFDPLTLPDQLRAVMARI